MHYGFSPNHGQKSHCCICNSWIYWVSFLVFLTVRTFFYKWGMSRYHNKIPVFLLRFSDFMIRNSAMRINSTLQFHHLSPICFGMIYYSHKNLLFTLMQLYNYFSMTMRSYLLDLASYDVTFAIKILYLHKSTMILFCMVILIWNTHISQYYLIFLMIVHCAKKPLSTR